METMKMCVMSILIVFAGILSAKGESGTQQKENVTAETSQVKSQTSEELPPPVQTSTSTQEPRQYTPMLVQGRKWVYIFEDHPWGKYYWVDYPYETMTLRIDGETTIGDKTYMNLIGYYDDDTPCYVREDNGKVYQYMGNCTQNLYVLDPFTATPTGLYEWPDDNRELLVYDFTLDIGEMSTEPCIAYDGNGQEFAYVDHMVCGYKNDWGYCGTPGINQTTTTKTALDYYDHFLEIYDPDIHGIYHPIGLTSYSGSLEGIGFLYSLLLTFSPYRYKNLEYEYVNVNKDEESFPYIWLYRVYEPDGTLIYDLGTDVAIGVEQIIATEMEKDDRMFDLYGREIKNPAPGTIFIRGGRKYVQPK